MTGASKRLYRTLVDRGTDLDAELTRVTRLLTWSQQFDPRRRRACCPADPAAARLHGVSRPTKAVRRRLKVRQGGSVAPAHPLSRSCSREPLEVLVTEVTVRCADMILIVQAQLPTQRTWAPSEELTHAERTDEMSLTLLSARKRQRR
jgi:hypothetical protein